MYSMNMATTLQPVAGVSVDDGQDKKSDAASHEDHIQHEVFLYDPLRAKRQPDNQARSPCSKGSSAFRRGYLA
jgi:hypothetical protein